MTTVHFSKQVELNKLGKLLNKEVLNELSKLLNKEALNELSKLLNKEVLNELSKLLNKEVLNKLSAEKGLCGVAGGLLLISAHPHRPPAAEPLRCRPPPQLEATPHGR